MNKVDNTPRPARKDIPLHGIHEHITFKRRARSLVSYRSRKWICCLLIGAIALGFNLYRIGAPSMWFDEVLSVERARQSLPVLWQIVTRTQPNMALYYILLHWWLGFTSLLGLHPTEAVVRFPSAVCAALGSVVVFLLGRRFLGMAGGVTAATLYLLNEYQLIYAQETRSYGMQLLLLSIAWYALLSALTARTRQQSWLACYVVAAALSVYVHLFSLFILLAQGLTVGSLLVLPGPWRERTRQQFWALVVSLASLGILIIPMLIASRVGGKTAWIPIPHPKDLVRLFITLSDHSKIYLLTLAGLCALGLAITWLACRSWGRSLLRSVSLTGGSGDKRLLWYQELLPLGGVLLCWLIVPVIASYIISQRSTHVFLPRYLVTIVPPLCLLVALGVSVLRWRTLKIALVLGLMLFAVHYVPNYYAGAQVEEWNTGSFWLERHYQANDGLVCYDNAQGCQVDIEYYLYAYPSAAHFSADSPGSFRWVDYDLTNRIEPYEQAVDANALKAYGAKHRRLFFIVARLSDAASVARAQAAQRWLDSHYQFVDQSVTHTMTVRLYSTR